MRGEHISSTSSEVNLGEDRLSFLPPEILNHIMSFLPTHEAVKTTLLSRMWRKMWRSLQILRFNYHKFPDVDDKLDCFLQFIRHTIAHHDASSLKTFWLCLWPLEVCDAPIDNEWVAFAVQHNVQNIALYGKLEIRQEMPGCLFTCRSIVTMELSIQNIILKWPEAAVLPNLRKLNLLGMALSENLGVHLSSVCPQLETFIVLHCNLRAIKVFSIASPRLRMLRICRCLGTENCVVKLVTPCLKQFSYIDSVALDYDITHLDSLSVGDVTFLESSPVQSLSAMRLARGISSARRLMVNEFFIKYLSDDVQRGKLGSILFHRLEMASLTLWPTKEQVLTTFVLLSRCPKLSILDITIAGSREPMKQSDQSAMLQFPDMLSQLSSVQITEFEGSENEMDLVRILLLNGPSLREMNIEVASEDDDSDSDPNPDFDSNSKNLRMTIDDIKSKILQMQDLARSSRINVSFS